MNALKPVIIRLKMTKLQALPPSDIQKEMFVVGFFNELRAMRNLQYRYERDTRNYWNGIFDPEYVYETLCYNSIEEIIHKEVFKHLKHGDLEFAYIRASGPIVRYCDPQLVLNRLQSLFMNCKCKEL